MDLRPDISNVFELELNKYSLLTSVLYCTHLLKLLQPGNRGVKHHNPNYCLWLGSLPTGQHTWNLHPAFVAVSAPWPTEHDSPQLCICACASPCAMIPFGISLLCAMSCCFPRRVPMTQPALLGLGTPSNTALPKALCATSTISSYKALCHIQWHQKPAHLSAMNISNGNPLDSSHAIRELNRLAAGSWHCLSLSSDIANVSLVFLQSELANQLPHFMVKYFNMVLFSFTWLQITCASISFFFGTPTPFATNSINYKEMQKVTYFCKTSTSTKQEERKKPWKKWTFFFTSCSCFK